MATVYTVTIIDRWQCPSCRYSVSDIIFKQLMAEADSDRHRCVKCPTLLKTYKKITRDVEKTYKDFGKVKVIPFESSKNATYERSIRNYSRYSLLS